MSEEKSAEGLVAFLLDLPIFEAEWVLWLLLALSLVSFAVMIERAVFYSSHSVDIAAIRKELGRLLSAGEFGKAAKYLEDYDSLETNVALFGLRDFRKGPDAVEDLLEGAMANERQRYEARLSFLATVGSNAPFIGLFGTVLGVIKAFGQLGDDLGAAGGQLMEGISEALVATGVGLMVAIPAVIAYNVYEGKVASIAARTELLTRTLLAELKSEELEERDAA